jgi:predicted HicB family RNase H-like nuclease
MMRQFSHAVRGPMTQVLSLRLPSALENTLRVHAARLHKSAPALVGSILEHSIGGPFGFSTLPDVPQSLDGKLDVRLPAEFVARLHAEANRLETSVSVYSRVILYAFYTKRLLFVQIGGRYTLAENHDQAKCA